jgi:hypothetical protein
MMTLKTLKRNGPGIRSCDISTPFMEGKRKTTTKFNRNNRSPYLVSRGGALTILRIIQHSACRNKDTLIRILKS